MGQISNNAYRNAIIAFLMRRDGKDCQYCHLPLEDDVTIDHIKPRKMGGPDELDNFRLVHAGCNTKAAFEAGCFTRWNKPGAREHHSAAMRGRKFTRKHKEKLAKSISNSWKKLSSEERRQRGKNISNGQNLNSDFSKRRYLNFSMKGVS